MRRLANPYLTKVLYSVHVKNSLNSAKRKQTFQLQMGKTSPKRILFEFGSKHVKRGSIREMKLYMQRS